MIHLPSFSMMWNTPRLNIARLSLARRLFAELCSYALWKEYKITSEFSAPVAQRKMRSKIMKKTPTTKPRKAAEMSAEYKFDYKKAKPNRFASRMKDSPLVVVVEPDVAKVFTSAEQVNRALRALISAMPDQPTDRR